MKCTYCGAYLPEGSRLCGRCGKLLPREQTDTETAGTHPSRADEAAYVRRVVASNAEDYRGSGPSDRRSPYARPVPPPEPTVTESYRHAWQQLGAQFFPLLLVSAIWFLIMLFIALVSLALGGRTSEAIQNLFDAVTTLLTFPLGYGLALAYLRAARGESPQVEDLFVPYQRVFVSSMVANILVGMLVILGLFLLIIPGIIILVRLTFVPFVLLEGELGPLEAIHASWQRSAGYGWIILAVWLLSIPIVLLGLAMLVVGVIPALMLVQLAVASLYVAVSARQEEES
jgi:uncharacterized membrane protein